MQGGLAWVTSRIAFVLFAQIPDSRWVEDNSVECEQWLETQMSESHRALRNFEFLKLQQYRQKGPNFSDCMPPSHMYFPRSAGGYRSDVCSSTRRSMPKRAVTGDTLESTGKSPLTQRGKLN